MYVVTVAVFVKFENVDQFKEAILDNARNTRKEPGNVRFDVLQAEDDPTRFLLYEVYLKKEDFVRHQSTDHYFCWRDTTADWMALPRQAAKFSEVFFGDE